MSRSILLRSSILSILSISPVLYAADSLDEMVVTATRTAESVNDSLASVTVISRNEIEASQATSVVDILRKYVPSVDFSLNGAEGAVSGMYLRGSESDHVLVLIDGVRAGSVTVGLMAWEHLSADMIDKIEVVRGPRSSLYGADAIGGIISITTRNGASTGVYGSVSMGSFDTQKFQLGNTFASKNTEFSIHTDYLDTEGFDVKSTNNPDDDGYNRKSLNLSLRHKFNDDVDVVIAGLTVKGETDYDGFGDNGDSFTNPGGAPQRYYSTYEQQNLSLTVNASLSDSWNTQVLAGEYRDETEVFDSFPGFFDTKRSQLVWQNDVAISEISTLTMGLDYLKDEVESSTTYSESSRDNKGVFAEYQTYLGAHEIQVSARQDDNQAFGVHTTGGISVGHALPWGARFVASYGTAFKAPVFNELYYPNYGNPDLKPEESETIELGVKAPLGGGNLSVSVFRTDIENLITGVLVDPATFTYEAQNTDKARIDGLEMGINQTVLDWQLNASLSLLDPINTDTKAVLENRVKKTLKIDVDREFGDVSFGSTLLAQDSRAKGTYNQEVAGYVVLDLRAAYRINKHLKAKLQVNNILDKEYQTKDTYNMAERNVMFTLSYQ